MFLAALVVAAAVSATPTAGANPGAPAPADGTYNYTITKGTDTIGKSSVTIKRSDIGLTVHETESVTPFNFTIDEIVDNSTLDPKAYTGTYARGSETQTTVRVAFDKSGATVTIDGVAGTAPLPNPPGISNAYPLEFQLMTGYAMLPAQIHAAKASRFSQIAPRLVLQYVAHVDPHSAAQRPSGVPANDALLSVRGQQDFDEWYDPSTFVVHALSVPSQQLLVTLTK